MRVISQLDYGHIKFPGTNYSWATYGCLATCLCMLLDKSVEDFVKENPDGWTADGNLKTDSVLAKYGYKLVRQPIVEGQKLPPKSTPVILRTSWYSPKYPTHFFVRQSDGSFVDPASRHNPKDDTTIRYLGRVNEIRWLEPIAPQNTNVCKCCKRPF